MGVDQVRRAELGDVLLSERSQHTLSPGLVAHQIPQFRAISLGLVFSRVNDTSRGSFGIGCEGKRQRQGIAFLTAPITDVLLIQMCQETTWEHEVEESFKQLSLHSSAFGGHWAGKPLMPYDWRDSGTQETYESTGTTQVVPKKSALTGLKCALQVEEKTFNFPKKMSGLT